MKSSRSLSIKLAVAIAISIAVPAISLRADDAAATYKAKCASCHAPDGKGSTPAGKALGVHDFSSAPVQQMSDAELAGIVSAGKNKMPGYAKSLKEPDIKDLVAYVRGLAKK
jgi:cytochrome c6